MKKLLFLVILGSASSYADSAPATQWSLRYLARASNFLLVASDSLLEGKTALCDLKKGQPEMMAQNLKALIDEKIKSLSKEQRKIASQQAESCEQNCTCDILSLAFEQVPESLNEKAAKITPAQRQECAKQFQEFCQSRLLKTIR